MKTKIIYALLAIGILMAFKPDSKPEKILSKKVQEKFAFVPPGTITIGDEKLNVEEFYISKFEVTNEEYSEFLSFLKNQGKTGLLKEVYIDSIKWNTGNIQSEPLTKYYHRHEAYNKYPVVNISYEGAVEYCKYLTETHNTNPELDIEFCLPTKQEWLRAAKSGDDRFVYAWGGPDLRNKHGEYLCNFKVLGDRSISIDPFTNEVEVNLIGTMGVAGNLKENADVTAPVLSYSPNNFGLYNMNGNAAEMISENNIAMGGSWSSTGYDVRNESEMTYAGANPYVGFRPVMVVKKK